MSTVKFCALIITASATVALSACSTDSAESTAPLTSNPADVSSQAPAPETATAPTLPTAADLNAVLSRAVDPNLPVEEKVTAVQGGEQAPELFDIMAASQAESGATFQIVDPVLPGYTPDSVLATAKLVAPDQPEQIAENVEFIFDNGMWKLSQSWACTLVTNTVAPEQVPPMCLAQATPQDPAAVGESMPAADDAAVAPPAN